MRERGRDGSSTSAQWGQDLYAFGSWHHATKGMPCAAGRTARLELKPFGIEVVIIEPGAIVTEFGDVSVGAHAETFRPDRLWPHDTIRRHSHSRVL